MEGLLSVLLPNVFLQVFFFSLYGLSFLSFFVILIFMLKYRFVIFYLFLNVILLTTNTGRYDTVLRGL